MLNTTNIVKDGKTVSGANMFKLIDGAGNNIPHTRCLDYELATFYVDWINEENTKPYMMVEILNHLNKVVK